MSLSAEDVVNRTFRQALRGYAIDDVDGFLGQVAEQLERMEGELEELRGRLGAAGAGQQQPDEPAERFWDHLQG